MLERRPVLSVFSLLILSAIASGCRGNSDEKRVIYNSSQDQPTPAPTTKNDLVQDFEDRIERLERKKIEAVQSRYRVECESNVNCGDSVGMLVVSGDSLENPENGVGGRCTAFVIGERFVMTNHHCVSIGKNLSMQVLFPETAKFPAENIRVTRIASETFTSSVSLVSSDYQDVTILELDRSTSRPSMSLSGKTLEVGDEVVAVVVDPVESGGLSRVKSCRVSGGGLLDTESDDHRGYRQVILRDCPIMAGNSGGMVLDRQGNVIAILYGATNPEKVFAENSPFPVSWKHALAKAQFSMANRIGCLSNELLAPARVKRVDAAECESYLYSERNEFFNASAPNEPLRDRTTSSTFVNAPEPPEFKDDRIVANQLMVPGCADEIGSYDLDAQVVRRSARMDDAGRMVDLRHEEQGTRRVRVTVQKFTEIEGLQFADITVDDGSAKKSEARIPHCQVPVFRDVIPEPFL